MSASFRPVKEILGIASSCFISADQLETLFDSIGEKLGLYVEWNDYSESRAAWIDDGQKFLDFLLSEDFNFNTVQQWFLSCEINVDDRDLRYLVGNMKSLAERWQAQIGVNGDLNFYIDSY